MIQDSFWLSDAELASLCHPLAQNAAKARFLRSIGLNVTIRPDGSPAVVRAHAEAVLSGGKIDAAAQVAAAAPEPEPNVMAFRERLAARANRRA